jgi:hypothetical protein
MKQCFKCKETKPLEDFYKHPQMADGRVNKCKVCNKQDVRRNRKSNIEHYRAYDRRRGNRQTAEYRKRYQKDNPIKYGAITMVGNAVRDGRLIKAKVCESEGCSSTQLLHGHHDDYAKPLEVRWLCAACHHSWHAANGPGLNG